MSKKLKLSTETMNPFSRQLSIMEVEAFPLCGAGPTGAHFYLLGMPYMLFYFLYFFGCQHLLWYISQQIGLVILCFES